METKKEKKVKNHKSKWWLKVVAVIVVLCVAVIIISKITNGSFVSTIFSKANNLIVGKAGEVTTITKSSLENVFEISELSSVDYDYNAVAYAYEPDNETVKYYTSYNGKVTAGIDFSKIDISIDDKNKIIDISIPNCKILDTVVDFGSMNFIFEDDSYETETVSQEAYKICQEDLSKRAEKEKQLLDLGKENAIAAIEALINPWVKQIDSQYKVNIK